MRVVLFLLLAMSLLSCRVCPPREVVRPLPVKSATFNAHPEHKGAKGSMCATGGVYAINYDFSGGGHGVGVDLRFAEPIWAEKIRFDARLGERQHAAVVICDSTGQFFYKRASGETPGEWATYEADVFSEWIVHWGGKDDGRVRLPLKSVSVNVDRHSKGKGCAEEVGDAEFRNLVYVELPESERQMAGEVPGSTGIVSYVISDFCPGTNRFSAGPRVFCQRNGNYRDGSRPIDDGRVSCDFARESVAQVYSEIPVWGTPTEYRLTVEAPAEAAGAEVSLVLKARRSLYGFFGRLDAPPNADGLIRQTLTLTGDLSDEARWAVPWGSRKEAVDQENRRVCGIRIARGSCTVRRPIAVRLVRLEAVVAAGSCTPPVLAMPPTGDEPPRRLDVSFLNLDGRVRKDAGVEVSLRGWNGKLLGVVKKPFPSTEAGACSTVRVALPEVVGEHNYIQYSCRLCQGVCRDSRARPSETSWTRPWTGEGTRGRRPDLPWGFGVYLHRTEDRYAYPSGYETPTNEMALAEAETRAELARKAGVKWERLELKPEQVTVPGRRGVYDFSVYDRLLDIADRNGLTCFVCCSHYWPSGYKAYTREAMDEWAKIVGLAVRRWKDRCKHWEIWNEANIHFWSGTVEQYVYLCNRAYDEIKAADPETTVMTVSTAGVDTGYIDKCIAAGMKYDTVSIHPYRAEPHEGKFLEDLASVTNRTRGAKTFLTEMGWPTGLDRKTYSERLQAGYFVRAYLTAAGSGNAAVICGYDFIDDGFSVLERENNFGIVRRDLTIKPAYRALAATFNFFKEGQPTLESRMLSPSCKAWIFRMGGRSAVWTTADARIRVKTVSDAKVMDVMGTSLGTGGTDQIVETGPASVVLVDGEVTAVEPVPEGICDLRTLTF